MAATIRTSPWAGSIPGSGGQNETQGAKDQAHPQTHHVNARSARIRPFCKLKREVTKYGQHYACQTPVLRSTSFVPAHVVISANWDIVSQQAAGPGRRRSS